LKLRSLDSCRLYTFVDAAYLHGRDPVEIARQLCDGGSDLIQLRAKGSSEDEVRRLAERLLPITEAAGIWLVVNDFPRVAKEVGAPICHLGQEDFFDAGHVQVSEFEVCIGLSSHAPEQAERAVAAGANYVAIGPVYPTGTKPGAKPVTLEYVRWAAANLKVPWFAIGGVNERTVDEVLAAGARRICVVSAILNAEDVAGACRFFAEKVSFCKD
jgi:thiamine-phosphate pyrophosphorylase